jgi:hypothetical protein
VGTLETVFSVFGWLIQGFIIGFVRFGLGTQVEVVFVVRLCCVL